MEKKPIPKLDKDGFLCKHAGKLLTMNSLLLAFVLVVIYFLSETVEIHPGWLLLFLAFGVLSFTRAFVMVCPDCRAPLDVDMFIFSLFKPEECWCCGTGLHNHEENI